MRSMHVTTQAIVLRTISYGEADRVVAFFGEQEGKLSGLAKSARVSKRRFGGALEPGSLVEITYTHRPSSELVFIDTAVSHISAVTLCRSLEEVASLSEMVELASIFLPEREPSKCKFDLLVSFLRCLRDHGPSLLRRAQFLFTWLTSGGYGPIVDRCSTCGKEVCGQEGYFFSAHAGGVQCGFCAQETDIPFTSTMLNVLTILATPDQDCSQFPNGEIQRVFHELLLYAQSIAGRPLKSFSFGNL